MSEAPQAFDLNNLSLAKTRMSPDIWREYVDTQFKYFTREYILQENITEYSYSLIDDGEQIRVVDPQSKEDIIQTFRRGVKFATTDSLRQRAWAEVRGFLKIEEQIKKRGKERFFVWISEPGLTSDGFDSHSFTFIGQVKESEVEMVAYKNWVSKEVNRQFLGLDSSCSETDLLESPRFLNGYNSYIDIIQSLDPDRLDISEDNPHWFLGQLRPFRQALISSLEIGDEVGARRAKRAHDNYAYALLYGEDQGQQEIGFWADQPEVLLRGSCGFSGGEGVVSSWFEIEGKYFNCPRCKRKLLSGIGIVVCIYCGLYKGDYKPKTGQICA